MKRKEPRMFRDVFTFALVFAIVSMFSACSDDKVAGGSSDDAGIIADLNVAGVAQKGPFAKGSEVTVRGIDCKTMEFTDEIFEGSVKNNMGEFVVNNVNLSTTCAVVEVTGEYRSEMTGKKVSDKLTLRALTNLKDRTYVNVNLLTNLEYERVMYYVAEKGEAFDKAKELAENDVLAAFGMAGESTEFESLDIFGTSDAHRFKIIRSFLGSQNLIREHNKQGSRFKMINFKIKFHIHRTAPHKKKHRSLNFYIIFKSKIFKATEHGNFVR